MEGKLIKHGHSYTLLKDGKMVAFAHPEDFDNDNTIGKLSLKNCQAIERGYDLDELAKHCSKQEYYDWGGEVFEQDYLDIRYTAYKQGFQKCLELMGDKKFSEEDLKSAILFGQSMELWKEEEQIQKHIQSLQQTEWDVEIEMECPQTGCDIECDIDCYEPNKKPKLDSDGCLILRRI